MPFVVSARTILQLGAELISSDAVAFYELIKNAFDADSKDVRINVVVRIPDDHMIQLRYMLKQHSTSSYIGAKTRVDDIPAWNVLQVDHDDSEILEQIEQMRSEIVKRIVTPDINGNLGFRNSLHNLRQQVRSANTWQEISDAVTSANYIDFVDTGDGMSIDDLRSIYLTIGTSMRLRQREKMAKESGARDGKSAPLGEKGVGRLSVMRLGNFLKVQTSKKGEVKYNVLEIDWNVFAQSPDERLENIEVSPRHGSIKDDPNSSGTVIRVGNLVSTWNREKLVAIVREEFSRLTDPFSSQKDQKRIKLRFNGEVVPIELFERKLFDLAHAIVTCDYSVNDKGALLVGHIDYRQRERETTFSLDSTDLTSIVHGDISLLKSLGPFKVKFYWYNRLYLTAVEGIGNQTAVRDLVKDWAGGLMLFRDGFRVNPYGSGEDDWLQLDKLALSAKGYKVNRSQIIGKVDISIFDNPKLVDQTNREGLQDNAEKYALTAILKQVVTRIFRGFLESVEDEKVAVEPVRLAEVEDRVIRHQENVEYNLKQLRLSVAGDPVADRLMTKIEDEVQLLRRIMNEVRVVAESYDRGRSQLVHLASMGLMVEIITHELSRATSRTLNSVATIAEQQSDVRSQTALLSTLEAQLRTLQKRLRVLDPLDTNSRQIKERFNLVAWVKEIVDSHNDQFSRHNIKCHFIVDPRGRNATIIAVKGMFVQILENLISNSVYWLGQQGRITPGFAPEIRVIVRPEDNQVICTDNGPGIPFSRRDTVFESFFTTKPPGDGKGLGLFVSREIASYHGATLELSDEPLVHQGRLNTFILTWKDS